MNIEAKHNCQCRNDEVGSPGGTTVLAAYEGSRLVSMVYW
jgi:hypothetical protein